MVKLFEDTINKTFKEKCLDFAYDWYEDYEQKHKQKAYNDLIYALEINTDLSSYSRIDIANKVIYHK